MNPQAMLSRVGEFSGNLAKVGQRGVLTLLESPASFKSNAFIVASAIMVASRIFLANKAALSASPEDKAFRTAAAVQTTMREAGGYTLSYLVLRLMQNVSEKFLKGHLQMVTRYAPPAGFQFGKELKNQVVSFATGHPLPEVPKLMTNWGAKTEYYFHNTQSELAKQGIKFGEWMIKLGDKAAKPTIDESLTKFVQVAPIFAATLPAIIFSGFALEWFSLKHAKGVVQRITGWLHPHQALPTTPTQPPKSQPFSVVSQAPLGAPRFGEESIGFSTPSASYPQVLQMTPPQALSAPIKQTALPGMLPQGGVYGSKFMV